MLGFNLHFGGPNPSVSSDPTDMDAFLKAPQKWILLVAFPVKMGLKGVEKPPEMGNAMPPFWIFKTLVSLAFHSNQKGSLQTRDAPIWEWNKIRDPPCRQT